MSSSIAGGMTSKARRAGGDGGIKFYGFVRTGGTAGTRARAGCSEGKGAMQSIELRDPDTVPVMCNGRRKSPEEKAAEKEEMQKLAAVEPECDNQAQEEYMGNR